jgi:hypothetical protein
MPLVYGIRYKSYRSPLGLSDTWEVVLSQIQMEYRPQIQEVGLCSDHRGKFLGFR